MNKKDRSVMFFSVLFLSSFIISILLAFMNNNDDYWILTILPLLFIAVLVICYNTLSCVFESFSVLLMVGCYYMRMVILPFIYVYFDYSTIVINDAFLSYLIPASLLTFYEFLVVMFFCNVIIKKNNKRKNDKDLSLENVKNNVVINRKNKKAFIIIAFLITFIMIVYAFYPSIISYFHFIFETNIEKQNVNSINYVVMQQTIPKLLYWLAVYAIGILQVILPIQIINYISKTKITQNIKFLLSLFVVGFVLLVATPDVAKSIIMALALCIILFQIYPGKKKTMIGIILIGFVPAVIFGIFIKTGVREIGNSISSVLQAYFSGIPNIATAFLLEGRPSVLMIFKDIIKATPFILSFFKEMKSTPNLFNYVLYGNVEGYHTQIVPMVGQSLFYFGFILAPIISVLSLKISLFFEKKYSQVKYVYEKYLYLLMSIYFAIAPVVYNFSIMISISLQLFLPCFFIVKSCVEKKKSKRKFQT